MTQSDREKVMNGFGETMEKQLTTNGENRFSMDQMTKLLSMGGLYKQ